jgi:two-component system sensor histidine kinase MtrB
VSRPGLVRSALRLLRNSIQLRALISTTTLTGIALVVLGGFLSYSIGDGLFQTRLTQVLNESQRAVVEVQNTFNAANVTDEAGLQTLMNSVVPSLESNGGSQERKVALLRTANQASGSLVLQSPVSSNLNLAVIPSDLRAKVVTAGSRLQYESVAIPVGAETHPGLVVGAPIQIPLAGAYELYLVFDLQNEQNTLDFVQRTLVFGGLISLFLIGMVSYFVTNWLIRPIRLAASVAEDISGGDLTKRLPAKGSDAIAIWARSFNKMTESLQKQITKVTAVSKMQQRFVADVSHELRTPLTTMRISGDMIFNNRDKLPPSMQGTVSTLNNQILRFEKLLADLLELSRFDADGVRLQTVVDDVQAVVGKAIQNIQPAATAHGSEINVSLPSSLVEVELDPKRIERLLGNLLGNAIEHGEGRPIDVHVAANESAVAISVTDYGVGMTVEQTRQVFERFWRGDQSRSRTLGGTGLGLAIAKEDAAIHNGWLEVWSRQGQGACFRLTLPLKYGQKIASSPLALPTGQPLWNLPEGFYHD